MLHSILIIYGIGAIIVFFTGLILGLVLKKDVLHGGVKLGVLNSFLLAVVWPLTFVVIQIGFLYEIMKIWKRL